MLWEDFSYFLVYLIQGCVTVFYMMQLLETRLPAVTTFCITMALNASVFLLFGVNNWDVVYTYRTLESDLSRGDYPGVIHFSFLSF